MGNQAEKAKYLANILGNLSVVSYGLALYQQQWWSLAIAVVATIGGYALIRRVK